MFKLIKGDETNWGKALQARLLDQTQQNTKHNKNKHAKQMQMAILEGETSMSIMGLTKVEKREGEN